MVLKTNAIFNKHFIKIADSVLKRSVSSASVQIFKHKELYMLYVLFDPYMPHIKPLQRLGCRSVRLIAAERSVPYLDAIFSHPVEALWTQLGAGCTLMTYTGVNSSSTSANSHLEAGNILSMF